MTYARNNATQVVARARLFTTYRVGYCANYAANCVTNGAMGVPITSAKDAWYKARYKHTTGTPPLGAMVYWNNGTYGHIAVSVGNWRVRSTDYPSLGRVGEASTSTIQSHFGMAAGRYLGWSQDLAGLIIAGVPGTAPAPTAPGTKAVDLTAVIYAHNLRPGYRNADVARFEKAIWNAMGAAYRTKYAGSSAYIGDGYYGTLTQTLCSDAYAHFGLPRAAYPGGTLLLQKLGFKAARV